MTPDTLLSFDTILALAEHESGANGLASDGLRQRVSGFIDWINDQGPYSTDKVDAMQRQILRLLVNRLRIAVDRTRFAGIADEHIERPIFIIGFPRSGTTLLHSLMAEDADTLSLHGWHSLTPSPPPGAGPISAGRIAFAHRAIQSWIDFCPAQSMMHPYIDKGAYQLSEDDEIFSLDFHRAYCYHLYNIPVLDLPRMQGKITTESFRFHREVLQHFQWNTGKKRWVCKGPAHQSRLEMLFEIYPDALCVWAHRPMWEVYPSIVSLGGVIRDAITGRPVDWAKDSRVVAEAMKAGLDRIMANSLIDDPRILHLPFQELADDPLATVQKVYDWAGLTMTGDFASRVRTWLADPENQVDRYGRYPYSYEALGLDEAYIRDLFANYSKRFDLE